MCRHSDNTQTIASSAAAKHRAVHADQPMDSVDEQKGQLTVKYRRTGELHFYKSNARTHSKSQIRKIADSIRAFGFANPVLIDGRDTIIAGHGRVQAAKLLGLEQVPTISLENLTPSQIRAYVIADNRLALDAGWDAEILRIELQHLVFENEVEIGFTGFEVGEIDLILGAGSDEQDADDALPEEALGVRTQLGDIWILGQHRIFCGDVRDEAQVAGLMTGRRANVVFTDPPYNVPIANNVSGLGNVKHEDFAMAVGEMSPEEFTKFLEDCLITLARFSEAGSVHFVCQDWRHLLEIVTAGKKVYGSLLNVCVWNKNCGGMGSLYRSRHELIFVFRNGSAKHRNNIQLGKFGRNRTNVWDYPSIRGLPGSHGEEGNLLTLHPTVKPVALIADALLDCSARGDLVLDGFLGSGSTLIAAERVGRTCYGIELDPHYVDVAIRRWQRYTGDLATHALSGQAFNDNEGKAGRNG